MQWKLPSRIKILEALGAVADDRLALTPTGAKVRSSSGGKEYEVAYSPEENAIMSDDNASYWQGTLGYPAIAYLLKTGVVPYNKNLAEAFRGIKWKDLNVKFKNDFSKTEEFVKNSLKNAGISGEDIDQETAQIESELKILSLQLLGPRRKPPQGY